MGVPRPGPQDRSGVNAATTRLGALVMSLGLVASSSTAADDHLVPLDAVTARLLAEGVLSDRDVRQAAAMAHLDPELVAARLAALSDADRRDLADRAARLEQDPVAGMSAWIKVPLILFAALGVLFVVLILVYVTCSNCD